MKIKISKSQWEIMGNKTGWNKEAQAMYTNVSPKESELRSAVKRMIDYLELGIKNDTEKLKTINDAIANNDIDQLKSLIEWFWGEHSSEAIRTKHEKEY